ncbi:hypothetical protein Smp_166740 [Schistosoma mansoni]|uniref:Ovule protein n=1 Tax=Schistosoma mansoni TaxID=6183 RepID=G4VN33_SCHMA|nr:hypothetical protein Smp_166740 [Schistosoma mansoni]|eukprot:XP_018653668.1 hypothetical protein Smp_166740 [Schistosoma mansoni]
MLSLPNKQQRDAERTNQFVLRNLGVSTSTNPNKYHMKDHPDCSEQGKKDRKGEMSKEMLEICEPIVVDER